MPQPQPPAEDAAPQDKAPGRGPYGRTLRPMTEADYALWKATKARPFNLEDEAERVRLLRETLGYAKVSLHERDGTDLEGREFAHDALKHAIMLGYRLVPPDRG